MYKKDFIDHLKDNPEISTLWEKYKGKIVNFQGDDDISRVTGKVIGMYLTTGTLIAEYKCGWLLTKDRRANRTVYIDRHLGKGADRGWYANGNIEIVKAEG